MSTFGEIRLFLTQLYPSVNGELIDGWINDRYREILEQLPWKREHAETVLTAPDSYQTGTTAVVQGSDQVVGTGTTFTGDMNGWMLRVDTQDEYYQFTFIDATHGSLDRGYGGETNATASFRLDQSVFLLPDNARIIEAVRPMHGTRKIDLIGTHHFNRIARNRTAYGAPRYATHSWDNFSSPPVMQMELNPIPWNTDGSRLSWVVSYVFEGDQLSDDNTGMTVLPWVQPGALKAGVQSDVARYLEKLTLAQSYDARFGELVAKMQQLDAAQQGQQKIRLADHLDRSANSRRFGLGRHVQVTDGDWGDTPDWD